MPSDQALMFDAPDALARLREDLDELTFGVVEMNDACEVLRYNIAESKASGLSAERVIGRHFFREVAPCTNNARVAGRFAQATLDDTIAYTFALRMKPVPVTLRMLRQADSDRMYLLVSWT